MRRASSARGLKPQQHRIFLLPPVRRKSLLLGTALASTLLIGSLIVPAPAEAVVFCPQPPGGPILINLNTDPIVCNNAFDITNNAGIAIDLSTGGDGLFIDVDNSGELISQDAVQAFGIRALTDGTNSRIDIVNNNDITANTPGGIYGIGIVAFTAYTSSPIDIVNRGDIVANATGPGSYAAGIVADGVFASPGPGPVSIRNSGELRATTGNGDFSQAFGIGSFNGSNSSIEIVNLAASR
ncbi:MAG: hypothetical protein FJX44_02000 [Alphaproteobacteria bacterium]|nr:hypothetical protein [Alphaproteobacteria bacterium]